MRLSLTPKRRATPPALPWRESPVAMGVGGGVGQSPPSGAFTLVVRERSARGGACIQGAAAAECGSGGHHSKAGRMWAGRARRGGGTQAGREKGWQHVARPAKNGGRRIPWGIGGCEPAVRSVSRHQRATRGRIRRNLGAAAPRSSADAALCARAGCRAC
ncbi:MAG: hypothetical protein J3K34DRAFT_261665 [Monoraphidium minutum]|nr:MAG: hypothetical protein J3K34DRAFT_261665 [Monoraphidium minutum]